MKTWRLLELRANNAFTNMAIDEAVATARIADRVPNTLRFYRWAPSAVSVGRFQDPSDTVRVEDCRQHGVDIVRRTSGGGTVYHDTQGEITYSVIVKERDLGSTDVVYAYKKICTGLIEAARNLSIKANFSPGDQRNCPNLAVGGRKISGSSQYHKGDVLLQHGTFLLNVDLEKMFTYLRVPWAQTISNIVCVATEKITSVKKELDRDVSVHEAFEALVNGFQKSLEIELKEAPLTEHEQQLASKLEQARYSRDSWNLRGSTSS